VYHERDTDHRTRNCQIVLESKQKMTQKQNQSSNPRPAKEVNHTMHWQQPSSSSSSYYPSYHHSNPRQENLPTYISPTVSVILPNISLCFHHKPNPPNPTIYNLPSATATNNTPHAKHTEPNTLSPLSAQQPEPSHQSNNFPTFGTIHTITGGSNLDFQNK
jgi:hypothetical protein